MNEKRKKELESESGINRDDDYEAIEVVVPQGEVVGSEDGITQEATNLEEDSKESVVGVLIPQGKDSQEETETDDSKESESAAGVLIPQGDIEKVLGDIKEQQEKTEKQLDVLENQTEEDKKTKKKLKRKVVIRNICIFTLILIIILLLFKSCSINDGINFNFLGDPDTEDADYVPKNDSSDREHIDVYTLMDATVNADYPYVTIRASKTNYHKFYLLYEFYINNETSPIYTTKYIDVSEDEDYKFSVDLYNLLNKKKGTYSMKVRVRAYDYDSLEEKNGASQEINVTVE